MFTIAPVDNRLWLMDGHYRYSPRGCRDQTGQALLFALRVIPELSPLYKEVLVNSEGGAGARDVWETGAVVRLPR
jgi:hypothetical protein